MVKLEKRWGKAAFCKQMSLERIGDLFGDNKRGE